MGRQQRRVRDQVLEFVESFVDGNGYPPTYDEIRESVGLSSKSHVDYYLHSLEEAGLIERRPRTPRGLRLVGLAPATFEVKVEGTIAAGQPIALGSAPDQRVDLTADIADPRRELFALEVQGDSMADDLIGNGDLLIVERRSEAERGQMAVLHLRDRNEATLKRIYPEGQMVRLQPAHPTMSPLYAHAADVEVQGRVVAIIRRL